MWIRVCGLALFGLAAGAMTAGGLVAFIIGLGVISDLADRTHTGKHVLLYEDSIAIGGIVGFLSLILEPHLLVGKTGLFVYGIFSGIFVGCWAMALAETLNLFPIFIRRTKLVSAVPYFILAIAVGKLCGALLFFYQGW